MRRNRYFPLLLILFGAATPCGAYQNQVEFQWGHGVPQATTSAGGSTDELGSSGNLWSADILHNVTPYFDLGLGGGEYHSGDNTSSTFISDASSRLSAKTSSVLVLGRLDFPQQKFLTYLIGGVGWVRNSLLINSSPDGTWSDGSATQRTIVEDSHSTLGLAGGIGLDLAVTSALVLGVEGRYQTSLKSRFDTTPEGALTTGDGSVSTVLKVYSISFKVGVRY